MSGQVVEAAFSEACKATARMAFMVTTKRLRRQWIEECVALLESAAYRLKQLL